jgi:hypothetical protein
MTLSISHLLRRRLALAGFAWACSLAVPCSAASVTDIADKVVTSGYLDRERCSDLGLLQMELIGALRGPGNRTHSLAREDVRAIAARYDEINQQLCAAVTPLLSEKEAWIKVYQKRSVLDDSAWDRFLADEVARRWADIDAKFRTELVMLGRVIDLEMALHEDVFSPGAMDRFDPRSAAMQQLQREIELVSLTEEEAKVRLLLALLHEDKGLREMVPARFELDSLARIEAKTRQLGVQVVRTHRVRLGQLFDTVARGQLGWLDDKTAHNPALNAALRSAKAQIDELAARYRAR